MMTNVIHNAEKRRFEIPVGDALALMEYKMKGDKMLLTHTEVPPEGQGRGVAGELAKAALEYARQSKLIVVPYCPFVVSYLKRHPEYKDMVSAPHQRPAQ